GQADTYGSGQGPSHEACPESRSILPALMSRGRTESSLLWGLRCALPLAGIVFRLVQFFAARSLWLDESMLALNIASRSLVELLRPLDYNPVAPPLFLLLSRLSIRLAGTNKMRLRACPILPAILVPPPRSLVAYRWLGPA